MKWLIIAAWAIILVRIMSEWLRLQTNVNRAIQDLGEVHVPSTNGPVPRPRSQTQRGT
jgi:hypothetical protein